MYDYEIIGAVHNKGQFNDRRTGNVVNFDSIKFSYVKVPNDTTKIDGAGFNINSDSCIFKCKYDSDSFKNLFGITDIGVEQFTNLVGCRFEPYFDNFRNVKKVDLYLGE